ncbi:hypothetical protein [Chitinophaga sp. CF418]|uniref:hypothetical protein n=1 Tax=Chitinophaga sp. CF418 TaxID=1855287 RepID=UPI00090F9F47|nr:hypothetical protein [Chitinophaga sp. CF418]SHN40639.1 hypothetical protein SAMN05216311_11269 [Chitinophaga sp. CF418]
MKKSKIIGMFVVLIMSMTNVFAQNQLKDEDETKRAFDSVIAKMSVAIAVNDPEVSEDSSAITYFKLEQAKLSLQQYQFDLQHQKRAFTWQFYSGIVIFFLVIIIVGAGLVLSYRQFLLQEKIVQKWVRSKTPENAAPQAGMTDSEFSLSKDGIKFNSAVIGLSILFLSVVFLIAYLTYVYPITLIK